MMLRAVTLGSSLTLVPIVKAATPVNNEPTAPDKKKPTLMKPSELPIYETVFADHDAANPKLKPKQVSYVATALHEPIKAVRETVQTAWEHTSSVTSSIQDKYHELQDRSDWIVKYLREEDNKEIRYGAVVMGGLTGFIFGLRGGIIRRLFYTGVGTSALGAVCFPEETGEIARNNLAHARKYVNIAYNFVYGVKPGDPQLELKFPELSLPKDLPEFFGLMMSLASTAKQAIQPPPKDSNAQPSDKKQ